MQTPHPEDQRLILDAMLQEQARLLGHAAADGDMQQVRAILKKYPNVVHARGGIMKSTPLHFAADRGFAEVVALLLDAGADVNAREGASGTTPLHWAAYSDHLEVARLLMAQGGNKEATDDWHNLGALGWAAAVPKTPNPEMVAYLLDQGAQMDIFSAIALERTGEVRTIVAANPGELRRRRDFTEDDFTPLQEAVRRNLPLMVKILLECGAEIGDATAWGVTPICTAYIASHSQTVDLLRQYGAEEDLSFWITTGQWEHAQALLRRRSDLVDLSGPCSLMLHLTARANLARSAALLLEHGIASEATGKLIVDELVCDVTPLHRAALYGHTDTVRVLLEGGVETDRRTIGYWDLTALHLASWRGHLETVQLLVRQGADLRLIDRHGIGTPLEWATHGDRDIIAEYLRPLITNA